MDTARSRCRAVQYSEGGDAGVLRVGSVFPRRPGPGEVRIRIAFSAVNPLDCKEREGYVGRVAVVPHYDGSGWVQEVGSGVTDVAVGDPVWIVLARSAGAEGTAQDCVVLSSSQVRRLPAGVSMQAAACLGIPALTAYRCLTVLEGGPRQLMPGALAGVSVLVPGGAGAVGNSAIQLARWAGGQVITTTRGPEQAAAATRAGAQVVIDRTSPDALDQLARRLPEGADIIVEVDPVGNAGHLARLCATSGVVAVYGRGGRESVELPMRPLMAANARVQWVRVITLPSSWIREAATRVTDALRDGAIGYGEMRGITIHEFSLEDAPAAHRHVETGGGGRVVLGTGASGPRDAG